MRPKFVNDRSFVEPVEEKKEPDHFGIKETKEPEVVKPVEKPVFVKDKWKDAVTTTLVNLREKNDPNSKILDTLKGGEIVKVSSLLFGDFKKVKYKTKEGFIKKDYIKEI